MKRWLSRWLDLVPRYQYDSLCREVIRLRMTQDALSDSLADVRESIRRLSDDERLIALKAALNDHKRLEKCG